MIKKFPLLLLSMYSFTLIAQQSYYDDVNLNLTGISLKNELANKIVNTHTNDLTYAEIWDLTKITDANPINANEVLLIYGWENGTDGSVANDRERDVNNYGGSVGQWNREHVYSNSLATPDLDQTGTDVPPYTDAHNLRSCDSQTNSTRGSKLFISGSGNAGAVGAGWYPGDEWKGDVARMIMYMYLRYNTRCLPSNVGLGNSSDTPDEMIDLFLQWNAEDPVSTVEIQRNDYHGNTSNSSAQGNRNPFIDNPILATRIWGGPLAEDLWGIYTTDDNEAPSVPENLSASNVTTSSIDLSWDASTDNIGVSSYDIFVNGTLEVTTSDTFYTITNLASNTSFSLTVSAKDLGNNESEQSIPLIVTTLEDTEAPTVPENIVISNQTNVSFKVTWNASTDNTAVTSYDVFLDGSFNVNTANTTYTINGLTASTTYSVTLQAKDAVGNTSAQSTPVEASTTSGTGVANELFFSEYVEGSSNNKALEIVNLTDNTINLSLYNIRRQGNGVGDWSPRYDLSGSINSGDVVVIVNAEAENSSDPNDPNVAIAGDVLIAQADIIVPNNASTNYGEPLNFNGNDPVGLFKNNVLIDIIGVFGNSSDFAKNVTLRRKPGVSNPNTTYDAANEWDTYPKDTVDDIGTHTTSLSTTNMHWNKLSIYPNPSSLNHIFVKNDAPLSLEVFDIFGKKIQKTNIQPSNPKLDITSLSSGVYLLRISDGKNVTLRKMIKSN